MRIAILGSGLMGGKLGTIFAQAGHDVVFSFARSEVKLKRLARKAKGNALAGSPREASQDADVILVAVHWSRMDEVLSQAGDLSGKVVITCSLPMNDANSGLVIGLATSGAEELARKIPKARIVSAFHTIPSEALFDVFKARQQANRPSLLYCGDDSDAKAAAARLIKDAGFEPLDAGGLSVARYTEPFALLIGELAYGGSGGPELTYRFDRQK